MQTGALHPFLQVLQLVRADELARVAWPDSVKRAFLADQFALQHRHYLAHYADAWFLAIEQAGETRFLPVVLTTATAVGGAAEYYSSKSENTLVLGASILLYRDNAEFAQYVEDYWGDVDYAESDANAFMLFAEYGPKYRFGQDNMTFVTIRGGLSGILASERSISNCRNCS